MRIKEINIVNFKGFQNKTIRFNGNLSVIIGDNASGKTTLLKALQVGLGAYLQSLSRLPAGKMYRRNFSSLDLYKVFDPISKDYISNPEKTRITISADFPITWDTGGGENEVIIDTVPVSWYRELVGNHTIHTKECAGELIDVVKKMEERRYVDKLNTIFPLILSFGINRISDNARHSTHRINERSSRIESAYKFALHDKVDFDGPIQWLVRYDKNIKDKKEFEETKEAFIEALQTAIPSLSEIVFDNGEIEAVLSITGRKPQRQRFSYMSASQQSMINIVSDIAHRCIELNGFLGRDAIKRTPGVIMIDQVEVYLHPRWQKHVLQDLMKAFPNIQFIVSTHSPFIVQSLNKCQLISFDEDVNVEGDPFRDSLEDIISERMGMKHELRSKRFSDMVEAAKELFEAVESGSENEDEIDERLKQIEAEYSDDPVYVTTVRLEYKARKKIEVNSKNGVF